MHFFSTILYVQTSLAWAMPGAKTSTIDSIAWLAVYHKVEHMSSNLADIEVQGAKGSLKQDRYQKTQ